MKPILFSTPMVQALLNTKPGVWPAEPIDASKPCKSQTRRVTGHQPLGYYRYDGAWKENEGDEHHYLEMLQPNGTPSESYCNIDKAHYNIGDILYVRETWADIEETSPGNIHYKASATEADLQWLKEIWMEVAALHPYAPRSRPAVP